MITAKATVALVLAYVLALAAGTTSGVLAERLRSSPSSTAAPLAVQLQLSPDQCEQMRAVWQDVSDRVDDCYHQAETLEHQRDQALVNLLTDEQKTKFAATDKIFAAKYAELSDRRQAAFQEAILKTKALLTPAQQVKYQEIVSQRLGRASMESSATQPSTYIMRP